MNTLLLILGACGASRAIALFLPDRYLSPFPSIWLNDKLNYWLGCPFCQGAWFGGALFVVYGYGWWVIPGALASGFVNSVFRAEGVPSA